MCPKRIRANDAFAPAEIAPAALMHPLTRRHKYLAVALSTALADHVVGKDAYDSVAGQYVRFCTAYSVMPWPVHPVVLGSWILQLVAHVAVQSLGLYMSGIKYHQGLLGYPWDLDSDCEVVRRVHRYVKRRYGMAKKNHKTSVTLQILRTILPLLPGWPNSLSHDDGMMAAASMTGLMGCLRGGEFTRKSGSKRKMLLHSQVRVSAPSSPRPGVLVDVAHPKAKWWLATQPVHAFDIADANDFKVSVLVNKYRAKSVVTLVPDGPAFADSQGRALTRDQLVTFTEALLTRAGIQQLDPDGQPTKVMSSSWRAGFVRSLQDADVSEPIIMACGRWASSAWQAYLAISSSDLQHAAKLAWSKSSPAPPGTRGVGNSAGSALALAFSAVPLVPIVLDRELAEVRASDFAPPRYISYGRSVNRSSVCDPDLEDDF
jgi:hypothetical protein